MTKLEELKEAYLAAWIHRRDAAKAAEDALDAAYEIEAAEVAAWAALQEELNKQDTTPREPVEDEGNSLV